MFGISATFLCILFITSQLWRCMAIQSNQTVVTNRGDFTYQASLRTYWIYHYCAGAIISDRWVLTSGACVAYSFFDINAVFAVLGGLNIYEGDSYPCDLVKKHDQFVLGHLEYDIALVRTSSAITFGEFIQPIPYYKGPIESDINNVVSIGWGGQNWDQLDHPLTYTILTVHPRSACVIPQTVVPATVFCGNDPATQKVEFAVPVATLCGRTLLGIYADYYLAGSDRPDVYTSTAAVANWIFQNTNVDGVERL